MMAGIIRDDDIDEVRRRTDIVQVISEHISLKKVGRNYKTLCPFHKEKTPSFIVDPTKQLYHCFGCGEGGNVYTFLMKMDKLDFPDIVKMLAERCGYNLHFERSKEAIKTRSLTSKLYEANQEAAKFYHNVLLSDKGDRARKYLKSRGYNEGITAVFKIGFALPKWDSLFKFLYKKGFKPEELLKAGLITRGDSGSFYDRFRQRIIFPILDVKGRVVGFGGRLLDDAAQKSQTETPKYLNSPETIIYHKSSLLYGLSSAKDGIVSEQCSLVVEGYTDVISLYAKGIKNAVATLGTALTFDHIYLLSRYAGQIKLVFDADSAGKAAAERGLAYLGQSKADIFVVSLPKEQDPADFVTQKGKEEFEKLANRATPLIDFCIDQALAQFNLKDSQQRIKASHAVLNIVAVLPSAVAQEEYLRKVAGRLGLSFEILFEELKKLAKSQKTKWRSQEVNQAPKALLDAEILAEKELIKLLLQEVEVAKQAFDELGEDYFSDPYYKELFRSIRSYYQAQGGIDAANFLNVMKDEKIKRTISRLVIEPSTADSTEKYFSDILAKLKEYHLKRQISRLKGELERLDPDKDSENYDVLFKQLIKLEEDKRNLRKY